MRFGTGRSRHRSGGMQRSEQFWGVLLALPAILGFLFFDAGPMIAAFIISLTDWRIAGDPSFIGLGNYREMLADDPLFIDALIATSLFAFGSVPLTLVVAFLVALLLNQQKVAGRSVLRTIYYLPTLVPLVANSILWLWMFQPDFGLLNSALERLGLPTSLWIYSETTAVPSLVLMSVWSFGNTAVIFLAGLQGVPGHLYEAVEIDGGGAFAKLRTVTIPMLTPIIFFNLVIGTITALQAFVQAIIMTQGGPNNATLFYVYYLYRTAFNETRMGYASALAFVLFLIVVSITAVIFRTARTWVHYEGAPT